MFQDRCVLAVLLATCLTPQIAACGEQGKTQNHNAALRYWMAFAMMQDPPADDETARLLADVTNGSAPWDEQRLGPIIKKNTYALLTLRRGTQLPDCDWGLDYELGMLTPLYHIAKGRSLGRLNALYGLQLASQGKASEAVDTWLAGLRFAQDLSRGGSLIGELSGSAVMISNLRSSLSAVNRNLLGKAEEKRLQSGVSTMPEYGIDWSEAVRFEALVIDRALKEIAESPAPRELYVTWFGEQPPSDFTIPTAEERAQYGRLMEKISAAFLLSPDKAEKEIGEAAREIARMSKVVQHVNPRWSRGNEVRQQIALIRMTLLNTIARRRTT